MFRVSVKGGDLNALKVLCDARVKREDIQFAALVEMGIKEADALGPANHRVVVLVKAWEACRPSVMRTWFDLVGERESCEVRPMVMDKFILEYEDLYAQAKKARKQFAVCGEYAKCPAPKPDLTHDPVCLWIYGPPGTGKSTERRRRMKVVSFGEDYCKHAMEKWSEGGDTRAWYFDDVPAGLPYQTQVAIAGHMKRWADR